MKRDIAVLGSTLAMGGVLFGLAGTLAWWNGWLFLAYGLGVGLVSLRRFARTPGLVEERRTADATAPAWDRAIVRLANLALPVFLIIAALDRRLEWLPRVPDAASVLAAGALLAATYVTYRAMAENAFFSSHVRIQAERGHVVVSTGPYGIVRHPGYAGTVVSNLLMPIVLGSWCALAPAVAVVALLVWRTWKEDRFLAAGLPGYAAYASRVRYRLVPGVW
jgi:protein-S-isoprenylcysteine O-methyltransferase Ste14